MTSSIENTQVPLGTTHFAEFYDKIFFYRKEVSWRVSFYIDDIITDVSWRVFENGKWVDVGNGFSARKTKHIEDFCS